MNSSATKIPKYRSGFTLIEVLLVVALIVVLAGLGLTSFNYVQNTKRSKQTLLQIKEMSAAISNMQMSRQALQGADGSEGSSVVLYQMLSGDANSDGQLDPDTQVFVQGMVGQTNKGKYTVSEQFEIVDPYGSPYRYQFPGQRNPPKEADIWSIGPDKINNTEDDITNW